MLKITTKIIQKCIEKKQFKWYTRKYLCNTKGSSGGRTEEQKRYET